MGRLYLFEFEDQSWFPAVIRNGMKTTTTEKKDFATGRVETTVFEENLTTGETVTRVSSNSVEL